jgi:hypothetical protein
VFGLIVRTQTKERHQWYPDGSRGTNSVAKTGELMFDNYPNGHP